MFTVNKACDVKYMNSTCCTQCLVAYGCVEGIASCAKVRCCIAYFGLLSHANVCILTWFPKMGKETQREGMKEKRSLHRTCKIVCILTPYTLSPSSHPLTLHTLHPFTPYTPSHPTPHTPHPPLTECIGGRHHHCHGPRTSPSWTSPRSQSRVGQHPKPRERHCRKLEESRIHPQGKLNHYNYLPTNH